jgi:ATP-binding cassette, subfamily B, bacterial PglK
MLETLKKIKYLITERQLKGLILISFLLFIGILLELFGLGLIIPIISILLDPDQNENIPLFVKNLVKNENLVFLLLFFLVIIYLIKTAFLVLLTLKENKFLHNISSYISITLFKRYINMPYLFHLSKNSSILLKNLQIEHGQFLIYITSFLTMIIEGSFLFFLILAVIYVEPVAAFSVGIFYAFLVSIFLRFSRKTLIKWGHEREVIDSKISKLTIEALGGIKNIIMSNKFDLYSRIYSELYYNKARISSNYAIINQLPRFFIEFMSIIGLVSFISVMIIQGKSTKELIPILGIFVAATFKMLPSIYKLVSSFQSIKYSSRSVEIIYNEFQSTEIISNTEDNNYQFIFNESIKLHNVCFGYNPKNLILQNIAVEIKLGESVGIIGESGSGKSTFIDLILGLHEPTSGKIIIDNKNILNINNVSWKNQISYVPQSIYLIDDSIVNNIAFGIPSNEIDYNKIDELIRCVELKDFVNSLKMGKHTIVGERGKQLSGGQIQRIAIARALYKKSKIIVLDEATSALDSALEHKVVNSINKFSKDLTIIIIAHRESSLKNCDRIFEIRNKSLVLVN